MINMVSENLIRTLGISWDINQENREMLNNSRKEKITDSEGKEQTVLIADSITVSNVINNPKFCEDFKKRVRHCARFTGDK